MEKTFLILLTVSDFLLGMQHDQVQDRARALINNMCPEYKDLERASICICRNKGLIITKDTLFMADCDRGSVQRVQRCFDGTICAFETVNNMFGDARDWIAMGLDNGEIGVLNLEEGLYKKFNTLKGSITRITASPYGNYLAIEYKDNQMFCFALSRSYEEPKVIYDRRGGWAQVINKVWTDFSHRQSLSSIEAIDFDESSCIVTYSEETVTWRFK